MISFATAFVKLLVELVRSGIIRKPCAIERTVIAYSKIYPILNGMMHNAGADRIVLLKTTNGGGIPKPGCTLRSSVLAEVYGDDLDGISGSWQEQRVDGDYVMMLSRLIIAGATFMVSKELDHDSLLSMVYQADEIAFSKVMLVETLPEMMIYVSINYCKGSPETMSPRQREAARAGVNQLAQVFRPNKGKA